MSDPQVAGRSLRRYLTLLIGIGIFGSIVWWGGRQALSQVGQPQPLYLLLGLLASTGMYVASSGRWTRVINTLAGRPVVRHLESFGYFMSGFLVGLVVSQSVSTVVVRSAALNRAGHVSLGRSVTTVVLDKGLDLVFILLFALPAIPYFLGWISLPAALMASAALAMLALLVAATQSERLQWGADSLLLWLATLAQDPPPAGRSSLLSRLVAWALHSRLARPLRRRLELLLGEEPLGSSQVSVPEGLGPGHKVGNPVLGFLLSPSNLVALCCYSIVKQVLLAIRLHFMAQAAGLTVGPGLLFLGVPFAQLSLLVAFTPGALGVLELGWFAVLAAAGIDRADSLTFVIAQRAYDTLYVIILAALSYLALWITGNRSTST